jgi:hypothetical protein
LIKINYILKSYNKLRIVIKYLYSGPNQTEDTLDGVLKKKGTPKAVIVDPTKNISNPAVFTKDLS